MKILKVELQNINSLKSDSSILIDFESEKFRDVGLFVITGPTGAGKTTILDAITIALYHNIPRFNGTKGTLIDVVSHGANNAFSRVVFENNEEVYEAFWGIRVADKSGKKYKSAKEEVSLKNLTTGVILATQKRILIAEINRVTQLDYNQFLRSVMLAQGQFASFLSAKGPDKGQLLEQITGEEVYKKIGQGILDRKSTEEAKLKVIESKINSDDVLTEVGKNELLQKGKILDVEIIKSEKKIEEIQQIVDWYTDYQKIFVESEKLDIDTKHLEAYREKNKVELALLDLNEKAEPFKDLVQSIDRSDKDRNKKEKQLIQIENELTGLKPEIERLDLLSKEQSAEFKASELEFTLWLPKFETITKLDSELSSEIKKSHDSKRGVADSIEKTGILLAEQTNISKQLKETEIKIISDQVFVKDNSFLTKVALEISNWNTELVTLKGHKEKLQEDTDFVIRKKIIIKNTDSELVSNKAFLTIKIAKIEKGKNELSVVLEQLSKNNTSALIAVKEKLSKTVSNWQQFKSLSEQTLKATAEKVDFINKEKLYSADLKLLNAQIIVLKTKIKTQELSVLDAEKILELEKSLSKYKEDRKNLIKNEPCGLCGSKVHPFSKELESVGVSMSALVVQERKEKLRSLLSTENNLQLNIVQLDTAIGSFKQRIDSIAKELNTFSIAVIQLHIDCELTDSVKIERELDILGNQIEKTNNSLAIAQQLQLAKDALTLAIDKLKNEENTLNTIVATLDEKIKNSEVDIDNKQKSIDHLTQICEGIQARLTTKLSRFNYALPSAKNTSIFIQGIENLIVDLSRRQKDLDGLKSNLIVIKNNLVNTEKNISLQANLQNDCDKIISACALKISQLNTKRIGILPHYLSVENKRESLLSVKDTLANKLELVKKELQKHVDSKIEKEALKVENKKEQEQLAIVNTDLKSALDAQLKNADFTSKEAIEIALLPIDIKTTYRQNKEAINAKDISLTALKKANQKEKDILETAKIFKTSKLESKEVLEATKVKKDAFLTEKGKIAEAFRKNQEIRNRNQEISNKIDAQQEVCNVWQELFRIIGNSKDAFNIYVQRLTLKHLLDLANVHLYKLNKRYSLKMAATYKPKEELNFNLIDHYQTDQARLVDTSSGGEKFIISLALALGLSDLASKNVKIDSLFIDEGFGTLDADTLEIVISTLETLQSQGKMIGIISHVENLKERITTQIQITKKSNGVSHVAIL